MLSKLHGRESDANENAERYGELGGEPPRTLEIPIGLSAIGKFIGVLRFWSHSSLLLCLRRSTYKKPQLVEMTLSDSRVAAISM